MSPSTATAAVIPRNAQGLARARVWQQSRRAGIFRGTDRALGDNRGLWLVCIEPGVWSAEG